MEARGEYGQLRAIAELRTRLRQQPEGRGAGLSADLHRHLHQGGLRQALRSQDAESAAHLLNDLCCSVSDFGATARR